MMENVKLLNLLKKIAKRDKYFSHILRNLSQMSDKKQEHFLKDMLSYNVKSEYDIMTYFKG